MGAGVGRAEDKLLDDADTAWKLNGGYRLGSYFALEAGYIDLGDTTDNVAGIDLSSSQDGFAGYLVGLLPLGDALALFGKLGAFAHDVDLDFGGDKATESGTELAYGGGLRYDFANGLGLLGEWERFDDAAGGDFDLFSVGLSYTF